MKKMVEEIAEKLSIYPEMYEVKNNIDQFLKDREIVVKKIKKWSERVFLICSMCINLIQGMGVL
jgi:hypothetical protein